MNSCVVHRIERYKHDILYINKLKFLIVQNKKSSASKHERSCSFLCSKSSYLLKDYFFINCKQKSQFLECCVERIRVSHTSNETLTNLSSAKRDLPCHELLNGLWQAGFPHFHELGDASNLQRMAFAVHDVEHRATLTDQIHLCTQFYQIPLVFAYMKDVQSFQQ